MPIFDAPIDIPYGEPVVTITSSERFRDDHTEEYEYRRFEGQDVRRLYFWLDHALRHEHSVVGANLLTVVRRTVYEQALNAGIDAANAGTYNLSDHADQLWKSGYVEGHAMRMGEIADQQEEE